MKYPEQLPDENPYRTPEAGDDLIEAPVAGNSLLGWKIVRQLAGWGLLLIGLAGLILPILPGWFFIAWGVVTLAPDVPFFGRLLDRIAHRVPKLRAAIERVRGQPENGRLKT